MSDYGQDLVNQTNEQVLKGTWEIMGVEKDLKVKNIGYPDFKLFQQYGALAGSFEQLSQEDVDDVSEDDVRDLAEKAEDLDNFSWESDDEDIDFIESVINEKLVKPDVDVDKNDHHTLVALIEGMFETWQEGKHIKDAKAEMPVDNPNR